MKLLIKMKFGSHLYGTNTPSSDTDYKGVFLPDAEDILLGRAPKTSITQSTGEANSKNTSEDVDTELFTLQGFLRMVAEGQMVALDMLFAKEDMWIEGDFEAWRELVAEIKANLLNKRVEAFVGYCRKQAGKYGIKGSRVGDVRSLLDYLKTLDPKTKLFEHIDGIEAHVKGKEFTSIIEEDDQRNIGGGGVKNIYATKLIECCNRKCTLTNSVKTAIDMYQKAFDDYGARALAAETNQGVDWKAMSHAIRACSEAIELLQAGKISFPLFNAPYLTEVKQGVHPYPEVAEKLEEMMGLVEQAAKISKLPSEPNMKWLEKKVCDTYGCVIYNYYGN